MLHGADSDIVWLQRDFGIYVVNLFDTGQASRVLGTDDAFAPPPCGQHARVDEWRMPRGL